MTGISFARVRLIARAALIAGCAAVALSATSAFASGGPAGGGGAGGGGGTATPPVTGPCGLISSFKATGGNYKVWGAIWVNYSVKNCGPTETLEITVTETNTSTGNVDWQWRQDAYLANGGSASLGNIDNDFGPVSTTYLVTITVTDYSTGAVLATQSTTAATGAGKTTP